MIASTVPNGSYRIRLRDPNGSHLFVDQQTGGCFGVVLANPRALLYFGDRLCDRLPHLCGSQGTQLPRAFAEDGGGAQQHSFAALHGCVGPCLLSLRDLIEELVDLHGRHDVVAAQLPAYGWVIRDDGVIKHVGHGLHKGSFRHCSMEASYWSGL